MHRRYYRYPALIGCITDAREPTRAELKALAICIRDEAFPDLLSRVAGRMNIYRVIWRIARVSLCGN